MKFPARLLITVAAPLLAVAIGLRAAPAEVGRPAPDFILADLDGHKHSLSEFKGRTVVLEWVNPECPIIRKHYDKSGNIPRLQKSATAEGVVWLSINSAAPGNEGDYGTTEARSWLKRIDSSATTYLRDPTGRVGRLYDARTTPHMFVIDGSGTLVYAGGIDSIRSSRASDIPRATNYVTEALADLKAGHPVRTPHAQPYGCSVKY